MGLSNKYSEDELIEKAAISIFFDQLNWDTAFAYNTETFGETGTLGRFSEEEVLLKPRVLKALRLLNPGFTEEDYLKAFDQLHDYSASKSSMDINKEKYLLFKNGIKITVKNSEGEEEIQTLRLFDFDAPLNNNFLAVRQLKIHSVLYHRRPDIIGFVNGIPLLFIELKAIHRELRAAYDANLTDYKITIPRLFHYNALVILSNGMHSRIGSHESKYEHFNEWKRITENEAGEISLETMLKGVCEKSRFMDMLGNFILFDESAGAPVKLIARNHQFIGVNNAIESVKERKKNEGRLGVFWHTQGSGKSYSMVMLCEKILRTLGNNYRFVIVTDREELDRQIYNTFVSTGAVTQANVRAESGAHLRELLKLNLPYVFTLIHKFNTQELISESNDIIVISDEAHRTQSGILAQNMRKAMPNASFIGFTGTPLFKDEVETTKNIFGEYVSKYDFSRSIEDGATVPLYYENRGEPLKLENPELDEQFREVVEESDLDEDQTEKLNRLFNRHYPILTSEKRLRSIAKDIVWHFNQREHKGKGMLVCIDKVTSVRMYNYITEYWAEYQKEFEKKVKKATDKQEELELKAELQWVQETEICVVVSKDQDEISRFAKYDLDITPHRQKMEQRDLETDFKNDNHKFRFVIVCAMWITGFDVKSLSTLYLDKPLHGHTLMQTIARANRVHTGKQNGLIVDYIETYKSLLDALAIYGETGGGGNGGGPVNPPIKEIDELVEELNTLEKEVDAFFEKIGFDIKTLISTSDKIKRIALIDQGVNTILSTLENKTTFKLLAHRFNEKFNSLSPHKAVFQFRDKRDAVVVMLKSILSLVEEADISGVIMRLQGIVDNSITAILDPHASFKSRINISEIDFKKILERFKQREHKHTELQMLMVAVQKKIDLMLSKNPFLFKLREKYEKIIAEYNLGKSEAEMLKTFEDLILLTSAIDDAEKEILGENLTLEEGAVFKLLLSDKKLDNAEIEQVKQVAVELHKKLRNGLLQIQDWRKKAQTQAQIRNEILNSLHRGLPQGSYPNNELESLAAEMYQYLYRYN